MKSKLPVEWRAVELGEIITLNYGKALTRKNRIPGNIPVYSSAGRTGWHNESLVEGPGIIVGRKGTIGTVYYEEDPFYCIDTAYFIERDSKYNLEYLYYLLSSLGLEQLNSDTAVPGLNRNRAYSVKFSIPPLTEQKAIADTLSALDDKIENNNRVNENLEQQAQEIFKHWFVDFEFPDENGMPYKSSGGEMVESELGMIPERWEIKKVKDFVPVITGKKNANIATDNGEYKFFTCAQEVFLTDDYSFEGKAILVAGNGDFNVKFYNGKFEAYQRTYVLIPNDEEKAGFLYYMMKYNLDKIVSNARGSVISYLTKGDVENSTIAFPSEDFENLIDIFDKINIKILNNNLENEKLAEIRDTLLPKLMSGELRIPLDE